MKTPSIPAETWPHVIKELFLTPGINRVYYVQLVPAGPSLSDATGTPIGQMQYEEDEQKFDRETYTPSTPVKVIRESVGHTFKVEGVLPADGFIYAPGALTLRLNELRKTPIPIRLSWIRYNPTTGEYLAVGAELLGTLTPSPIKVSGPNALQ